MTKRIKFTTQTLTGEGRRLTVSGYRPTPTSRFAVTRDRDDGPWLLTHIRSGAGVTSILPARGHRTNMTDKLAVCAAWETLTHLDWSAFDELPQVGPDSTKFPVIDVARAGPVVQAMRETANQVLA